MNNQGFQSVYLDLGANKGSQRIVFHDPMFETGPVGVTVLTSDRLADLPGFVFTGPKEALNKFRKDTKDIDKNGSLGKLSLEEIIQGLTDVADSNAIKIYYKQNLENGEMLGFFDPLTKRRLIQQGPAYFDPSLRFDRAAKASHSLFEIVASSAGHPDGFPSTVTYPSSLNHDGILLWKAMFKGFRDDIEQQLTVDGRWNKASEIFLELCQKHSLDPVFVKPTVDVAKLQEEIEQSVEAEEIEFQKVYNFLKGQGLINPDRTVPRKGYVDTKFFGGKHHICTERILQLTGLASLEQLAERLFEEFKYYPVLEHSGFNGAVKQLGDRLSVTVLSQDPGSVKFGASILLNDEEFRSLNGLNLAMSCKGK